MNRAQPTPATALTALPPSTRATGGGTAPEHQAMLDAVPLGVVVLRCRPDAEPVCDTSNAMFDDWCGHARHVTLGLALSALPLLGGCEPIRAAVARVAAGETPRPVDWVVASATRDRHLTAQLTRLPADPPRVMLAIRDRSGEMQAERNLRQTMMLDALTGLPNRVMFTQQVEDAIEAAVAARDAEAPPHAAVLALNINRFKAINDSLGHVAGDELLTSFARRLIPCVRGADKFARLSGDDFAVLVNGLDLPGNALAVAARIHRALAAPFVISGRDLFVSASVGIATTQTSQPFADELMRDADFAMHRAKAGGVARTEIYQPTAHTLARDRFQLEADLRRALERGELELHYQPLVDLASGGLAGFEALARWNHPERGRISPVEFIPLAEETGLIVPIGRWALDSATRQLAAWRATFGAAAEPLIVGVNLSGVQLARDDVVEAVTHALAAAGLPGDRLKIELTESVIVESPQRATAILKRLKALDVQIAMDDFGTGYSSLAYLQRLPIDVLKIDRSFVAGMLDGEDSFQIVMAILSLSKSLGKATVAEGIEHPAQAEKLAALGCDFGQGFHFARGLSVVDAEAYLAKRFDTIPSS